MSKNDIRIQDIDKESVNENYFCAFHEGLQEIVAVIVFHEDSFSLFWSNDDLSLGIQLEVYFQAREMLTERLG